MSTQKLVYEFSEQQYIAQECKQPKSPSTDKWVNEMSYIHIVEC